MRNWWFIARTAVNTASNRPDEAHVWFDDVKVKSFKKLGDTEGFETLDWKLKATIFALCKGDWGQKIFEREETQKAGT